MYNMHKLRPCRQGAVEYVRLANLSDKQAGTLMDWLPQTFFTKVKDEEQLMDDCIEYEDYEFWYEHCFQPEQDLYEEEI